MPMSSAASSTWSKPRARPARSISTTAANTTGRRSSTTRSS
jgi:hypothetical protein